MEMIFSIVYMEMIFMYPDKNCFSLFLFHHLSTPGLPIPDYILFFRFSSSQFKPFYNVLYIKVYESVQR